MISTHRLVNVPVASRNPMNGGTVDKEGIKKREISKRGKEWTNMKERGGFGDIW